MRRHAAAIVAALFGAIIVIDGDAVKLDGKRYRLLGCDTPETRYARCPDEKRRGKAAAARLKELLETRSPQLVPAGKSCKWRRECAWLYLDGENACEILIREQHAVEYRRPGKRKDWCRDEPSS